MAKQETITLRVEKPVKDRLTDLARQHGVTRGEMVRRIIMERIKEER